MNIKKLLTVIPPLDLLATPVLAPEVVEYLLFYQLDFATEFNAKHHVGWVQSGEFQILCHYFSPPQPTTAVIMLHGYFDHSGLCGHYIRYFLSRGMAVGVFDLPGHGLSSGTPASIDDFVRYREAFMAVDSVLSPAMPSRRLLFGQSTGGAVVMDYLLTQNNAKFAAAILFAPLVRPHLWWFSRFMLHTAGFMLDSLARGFAKNSSDTEFLTFLKFGDPLQSRRLPIQWVRALEAWIEKFLRYSANPDMRLLVVQGGADRTVDWRYNLTQVRGKFPLTDIRLIEGARHHLLCESESVRNKIQTILDGYLQDVVEIAVIH